MPALQAIVSDLNAAFAEPNLSKLRDRADLFLPGKRLRAAALSLKLVLPEPRAKRAWLRYLDGLPPGIHEALRSVIYSALTTKPRPVAITFAWAPAYDFELTIWQAPDTRSTRGGITALIRSRYPGDKHPIAR
jgi:hypothetical protein